MGLCLSRFAPAVPSAPVSRDEERKPRARPLYNEKLLARTKYFNCIATETALEFEAHSEIDSDQYFLAIITVLSVNFSEMKESLSFHPFGKWIEGKRESSLAHCDVIEGTDTVDPPLCQVFFLHLETILFFFCFPQCRKKVREAVNTGLIYVFLCSEDVCSRQQVLFGMLLYFGQFTKIKV